MKKRMFVMMLVVMFLGACAHTRYNATPNLPTDEEEAVDEDDEESDADYVEYCGALEIPANCECDKTALDGKVELLCKGDGVEVANPGPGTVTVTWGSNGTVEKTATIVVPAQEQFTPPPEIKAEKKGWTTGQKVLLGVGMGIGGALLGVGGYYLYDSLFPPTVHLKNAPSK